MKTIKKFILLASLFFFGENIFAQNKYDSNYMNSYYEQKTTQHKLLPKSKHDIIFLGNSITDIAEWAEVWQNKNVKNRGISSDITFGVLARLNDIVVGKPAKIFIMIGINDIARNIPDSVIVINYKKIIDSIVSKSPDTKLYVQSILPTNNDFTEYKNHQNKTEHIIYVNNQLLKICDERKVSFVNLYPNFVDENGKLSKTFTNDGLHLTGAGYMQWKKVLQKTKLM